MGKDNTVCVFTHNSELIWSVKNTVSTIEITFLVWQYSHNRLCCYFTALCTVSQSQPHILRKCTVNLGPSYCFWKLHVFAKVYNCVKYPPVICCSSFWGCPVSAAAEQQRVGSPSLSVSCSSPPWSGSESLGQSSQTAPLSLEIWPAKRPVGPPWHPPSG